MVLQQKPPSFRIRKTQVEERKKAKELSPQEIKNIYKYDLFGTFFQKVTAPSLRNLVTPIPQPKRAPAAKAPTLAKPDFLPALKVTLKGIAYSADEEKSICIVEDETKKEHVYHVGDMVKDAQIIKIAQNRITLLRVNGQHETIFLRKEDVKKPVKEKVDWTQVVKQIDQSNFDIDFIKFPQHVSTLGAFTEMLNLLTTFKDGKAVGTKVGVFPQKSIGPNLGLKPGDTITLINGIPTANKKNRIKIYDTITKLKMGDVINVTLQRNNQEQKIAYKLTEIKKPTKRIFAPEPGTQEEKKEPTEKEKLFKLSKLQEREKMRRDFAKRHENQQPNVIAEIRKRLLENMRARVRDTRIR